MVLSATVQLSYHFGFGRHYYYLTASSAFQLLKWAYIAQAFGVIGATFGRASFGFYLLSIIGRTKHTLRYPLWSFIGLQFVLNLALLIALFRVCGTDVTVIGKYVPRHQERHCT